jgi:hypothetical protein
LIVGIAKQTTWSNKLFAQTRLDSAVKRREARSERGMEPCCVHIGTQGSAFTDHLTLLAIERTRLSSITHLGDRPNGYDRGDADSWCMQHPARIDVPSLPIFVR